jgi:hypothetical protein
VSGSGIENLHHPRVWLNLAAGVVDDGFKTEFLKVKDTPAAKDYCRHIRRRRYHGFTPIVHVEPAADGKPGAPSTVDQRAIRSQAMKDFRRRQREEETISFLNADRNGTSAPSQNNTPASDRHDSGSQKLIRTVQAHR